MSNMNLYCVSQLSINLGLVVIQFGNHLEFIILQLTVQNIWGNWQLFSGEEGPEDPNSTDLS